MDESDKRHTEVNTIAANLVWDRGALSVAGEIRAFLLSNVADAGTGVDSGCGNGNADLWVTVDGVEYYIHIRLSNAEKLTRGIAP
jgi:hypothetical protein